MSELAVGIPKQKAYLRRTESSWYRELEPYADRFLRDHHQPLSAYSWVSDPFHQWSRQWEYPFVAQQISNVHTAGHPFPLRVLDAGSGITFFPFFLADRFPGLKVTCIDADASLLPLFAEVNATRSNKVSFDVGNLRALEFRDESFDVVYSISVLEHVDDRRQVVEECARILRPKGSLVLTFDISMNDKVGLTIRKAHDLMDALQNHFDADPPADLHSQVLDFDADKSVTTDFVRHYNPSLLPWKRTLPSEVRRFVRSKLLRNDWRDLTFCCLVLRKRSLS
jgi:2-polyprenyl-3-methyl-5-hydroxy-6-metoxy-1,4-benzoquinol methylase